MTYTRRAFSVALAAASMTFGLLLGHADAQQTATAQPAQFAAQLVPGQSYTITVPDDVQCRTVVHPSEFMTVGWAEYEQRYGDAGYGPQQRCGQYPGRTFSAVYEGPCPNNPSLDCYHWGDWAGILPRHWVS